MMNLPSSGSLLGGLQKTLWEDVLLDFMWRSLAWARTRISSGNERSEAWKARDKADRLRDVKEWEDAARYYSRYLRTYPGNSDLWIQLGNMEKEQQRFGSARRAYKRALALRSRNEEAWRQLGYMYAQWGRPSRAARAFSAAYRINPESSVVEAIGTPGVARHLSTRLRRQLEARMKRIASAISPYTSDVTVQAVQGFRLTQNADEFELFGSDPWIELILPDVVAHFGLLVFDFDHLDKKGSHNSSLYVDYDGDGYSEALKIDVGKDGVWDGQILLAAPASINRLRWDPADRPGVMRIRSISYTPFTDPRAVEAWIETRRQPDRWVRDDGDGSIAVADFFTVDAPDADQGRFIQYDMPLGFSKGFNPDYWDPKYREWIRQFVTPTEDDYRRIEKMTEEFSYRPKFSIVIPVYNPPLDLLAECIDSILAQTYDNFEICIADDKSPNLAVRKLLSKYAERDSRIKICFRSQNGHISEASNSALEMANGDYVVLVDNDDIIPTYTLFVLAYYINLNPKCKILYSDEDKIDLKGARSSPYFKGNFNQFLMYGHNMVSHLGVYDRELVQAVGGFRKGFEGSQDYDLFLRCFDRIDRDDVVHVPHVLYHWRTLPGSTAVAADQKGYAIIAAHKAIDSHFQRKGAAWRSVDGFAPGVSAIEAVEDRFDPVSIIIPTRDGYDVLKPCIDSILDTDLENVELIIVDNGSTDPVALKYLEEIAEARLAKVLQYPAEFNYSAINNFAAQHATGEILCFLNNDTEIKAMNWLARARALLATDGVGMVGAKLLYPDLTVQHFGIVLGLGGHRVAGLPHAGFPAHVGGYFGKNQLIQEFSAVTAACMFIKAADFAKVGGFDTALRVAYNDVDLCLRIRTELKLRIVCDPEIQLIHRESKTRGSDAEGEAARRLDNEAGIMRKRWGSLLLEDPYYSPNLSLDRADFGLAYPPRQPLPWRS